MRPDYLIISAWGAYRDKVEIDFQKFREKGLFLITGATGAGKTTIFDAITYALYGTLSGDIREKGSVRSDFAAGEVPTFVELTMTQDGKEFRIVRNPEYLRPKRKKGGSSELTKEKENAVLYLPDGRTIEGTKEVNAKMQEILTLAPEQFKQISMIAQGQFSKMLTAPAKDKVGIFREIFGTGVYERFARNLREQALQLEGKASEQKHKLEEDIRLLLDKNNLKTDVIFEKEQELSELTKADNWNYEAVEICLLEWKKEVKGKIGEAEEHYVLLDGQVLQLAERLTGLQERNRKIKLLQETVKKREELSNRKNDYEEIQTKIVSSRNAVMVQGKENALLALQEQIIKNNTRCFKLKKEVENLEEEKNELQSIVREKEALETYFQFLQRAEQIQAELEEGNRKKTEAKEDYQQALQQYCRIEKDKDVIKMKYDTADRKYKHAVVGIAAGMLLEGMPCPVCGSLEHPKPTEAVSGLLSEEELTDLKKKLEGKERELAQWQEKTALRFAAWNGREEKQKELEKTYAELAHKCGEKQEELCRKKIKVQELSLTEVERQIAQYNKIGGLIQSKRQEMAETAAESDKLEERRQLAEREFQRTLAAYGFESEEDFGEKILPKETLESMEREYAAYKEELAGVLQLAEHLEKEVQEQKIRQGSEEEEENLRRALAEAKEQKEAVRLGKEKQGGLLERLESTYCSVKEKREKLGKIGKEYGYVKELDNLASGNNKKRLVFEQYVLAGYFDRILRAANLRFSAMTDGRYEMFRMEQAADGRTKNSLEIEVMDYYTGKKRSVKTLSGGESFKASLSLALGLSDVIQAVSGGVKVEALFVDEGFGALDGESLDMACEMLQSLVEKNRMIGIISHVQELKERIDCQIVVERSSQGSTIKEVTF